MDVDAILKQLRTELETVNESIIALERMAAGGRRGPGRPPKWLTAAKAPVPAKRRGRPPGRGTLDGQKGE